MIIANISAHITELHRNTIIEWLRSGLALRQEGLLKVVEENHAFNFQLWNAEDRARREDMGHSFVYDAKREIDYCNQQRNNRIEAIDEWFAQHIPLAPISSCPVHSETPGMMIDRLSILSLKSYHMTQQSLRATADEQHRQTCSRKLSVIQEQHLQLTTCLTHLLNDLINQTRTFRLYYQFKMYNDPMLNPQLYEQET